MNLNDKLLVYTLKKQIKDRNQLNKSMKTNKKGIWINFNKMKQWMKQNHEENDYHWIKNWINNFKKKRPLNLIAI